MNSDVLSLPEMPPGRKELLLVLVLSLCFSGAWVAMLTLPLRFAVAATAGMGLLAVSCFVENKRMFFLSAMTLALILNTSKRLILIHSLNPDKVDSISISLVDTFLILSYGIWFLSALQARTPGRPIERTLVIPFLGLIVSCLFSFVNIAVPARGVFEVIRMFKTLALYGFLIYNIRDLKEVRWLLLLLAAGVLTEFGVCLIQKYVTHGTLGLKYFGEAEKGLESFVGNETIFRAGGTLGHPNYLAYYLDFMTPLMFTRIFALRSGPWTRWFYFLAFAAACGCLYFTQSRGGIAATGLSLTLCFAILAWRNFRLKIFPIQTLAVVVLAGLVLVAFNGPIFKRFRQSDAGAVQNRIDQYRVAYHMLSAHPWVGVGLNSYVQVASAYDDTASRVSETFTAPVHNVYLLTLTETGIIGMAGLAWLIVAILRLAWFGRWPYGEVFDLHLGFFSGIVAYLIHANVDMNPMGSYTLLFFILGMVTVVHQIGRHSMPNRVPTA